MITKISLGDNLVGESYHQVRVLVAETWQPSGNYRCNKNSVCFQLAKRHLIWCLEK